MPSPEVSEQSAKFTRVRIALVQLECHPALAVDHDDWLSEPFLSKIGGPLRRLAEQRFPNAEHLRKLCRREYLHWSEHRLRGVCDWFRERFSVREPLNEMPDILVFPECGVPLENLHILKEFAQETKTIIFAGTHSFPVDGALTPKPTAANIYQDLGIINQCKTEEASSAAQPPDGIDNDTQEELHRILSKNVQLGVPSLSVLPIITPNDPKKYGDGRERIVRLRVKTVLSPFERTEASMGYHLEPPQVLPITLPRRRYRSEATEINVLPLVCAEALHIVRVPPQGSYQLAVVVSLNENFDYFEPVLKLHRHQQIPIAYCNDSTYGSSTVCFPREDRQADAFYGPVYNGRLPIGDSILVADVTLGVNASVRSVSYTQQFYSLVSLASIVQKDDRLPAYQVAKKLGQLKESMQRLRRPAKDNGSAPTAGAPASNVSADPFRAAASARHSLHVLDREYQPTLLQKINLIHLKKLLDPPCNAYPNVWDIHAWDCVIKKHDHHSSLTLLESDLAAKIFAECSAWFDRHDLEPVQASVVAEIRRECQGRMREILHRVLAQLERTKADARTKAKERLFHQLGALVERFGATSGWLLPVRIKIERNAGEGAPIIPEPGAWEFREALTHNSTNRYKIGQPQSKRGIVGHVVETGLGYLSNHVVDAFEEPLVPYYKLCIPTTRSELTVPIWEPPSAEEPSSADTPKRGPRLIAVLNLESNQFGAFLPVLMGELQAAVAPLVPDLIVYENAQDDQMVTGWHPAVHGWGSMHIIDRFCYAVANATHDGREEPSLTCTIWNFDEVKGVLYARGTSGFDYEYLMQRTLDLESFSGKVVQKYLDKEVATIPGPRVYRLDVLTAVEQDNTSDAGEQINWYDFRRKQKIDRMGMSKLIVTPLLRYASEAKPLRVFGTLNLYFYRHDEAFAEASRRDPSQSFTDAVVLRTGELVTRLVTDFYQLRERVIPATLAGRLAEHWQHGVPPFEIIKKTLAECLEGDGVTLLAVNEDEQSGWCFKAVATTGMEFQGIWINPQEPLHLLNEVANEQKKDGAIVGMTSFLLGCGGRTLRLLNVADRTEEADVTLSPLSDRPRRGNANGKKKREKFMPVYRSCEALPPAEYWKHRFLGASFGTFEYDDRKFALGALRVIRSANARPFVRHDEILLGDIAAQVAPLFEAWHADRQNKQESQAVRIRGSLPQLAVDRSQCDVTPFDAALDADWLQQTEQAAIERLVYRSRGPVTWNRLSIHGLLQDLLYVFHRDGAILADLRFTVVGNDGEVLLRPYTVVLLDSQQPPDERRSRDVSARHTNNGWRAIRKRQPILFEPDDSFTLAHQTISLNVESGINWPFRVFAHGNCVDGVLSLDFNQPIANLRWQFEHAELLALVTRQLAWMATSNSVWAPQLPPLNTETEPRKLLTWFVDQLAAVNQAQNSPLRLILHSFMLLDLKEEVWTISAEPGAPEPSEWLSVTHEYGDLFSANSLHQPDSELIRYGVQFAHSAPLKSWREHWAQPQRFRFPLYLGASHVGYIEGSVQFENIQKPDGGADAFDAWRTFGPHFRCFANQLDHISELWCAVVNGNAPLALGSNQLWKVCADPAGPLGETRQFHWPVSYSWPWAFEESDKADLGKASRRKAPPPSM